MLIKRPRAGIRPNALHSRPNPADDDGSKRRKAGGVVIIRRANNGVHIGLHTILSYMQVREVKDPTCRNFGIQLFLRVLISVDTPYKRLKVRFTPATGVTIPLDDSMEPRIHASKHNLGLGTLKGAHCDNALDRLLCGYAHDPVILAVI
ncbi:hypothetical protein FHL15_004058 [Xylaria flabelliformis]|uniref:Uncharacterized protein n=1 Tax=Xylaria flabelliformis TaxID=2512241 RepID=A0A553I476_9PEZI|nr:hypothetical protein FHL15_004058 [Xylaria flabelliformis]